MLANEVNYTNALLLLMKDQSLAGRREKQELERDLEAVGKQIASLRIQVRQAAIP